MIHFSKKHWLFGSICSFVLLNVSNTIAKPNLQPQWIMQRPIDSQYYIGIAAASKKDHPDNYREVAKNEALHDLSSEICINIAGDFVSNMSEKLGITTDEVVSRIRSSTQAHLEGYEQVGVWEDAKECWYYYRLSKSEYKNLVEAPKLKAMGLSRDIFLKARQYEENKNIGAAFTSYLEAYTSLEKYMSEPLNTTINGKPVYLQNEIYTSLQNLVTRMEFVPSETEISVKIGQPYRNRLGVTVFYTDPDGTRRSLANIPVGFYFTNGGGRLEEYAITGVDGVVYCSSLNVTATDKQQVIKVQPDITFSGQDSLIPVSSGLLQRLTLPEAKINLNVSGLTIYISEEEYLFGKKLDNNYIQPQVQNKLISYGYVFTNDSSKADLMVTLKAISRQGEQILNYNLFSAFADVSISIADCVTGKEIYKTGVSNIKEVKGTFEKAGIMALITAGKELVKSFNAVINQIQN